MSNEWSDRFPQQEGFYFARESGRDDVEDVVRVVKAVGSIYAYRTGITRVLFASDFRGYEFLGPVTPRDAERAVRLEKASRRHLAMLRQRFYATSRYCTGRSRRTNT